MKFVIEKIVMPLELSGYHENYNGHKLLVWVNPPREVKTAREDILRDYSTLLKNKIAPAVSARVLNHEAEAWRKVKAGLKMLYAPVVKDSTFDALNQRMFDWLYQIWHQHAETASAWPVSDIRELYDADPALYQWMVKHTIRMMDEFQQDIKKK